MIFLQINFKNLVNLLFFQIQDPKAFFPQLRWTLFSQKKKKKKSWLLSFPNTNKHILNYYGGVDCSYIWLFKLIFSILKKHKILISYIKHDHIEL
jgi:hypothetical protein